MPEFRIPNRQEITVPNMDYLTAAAANTIKLATGEDVYTIGDRDGYLSAVALLGWWEVTRSTEWNGIGWPEVRDTWPTGVFRLVTADDDADDVNDEAAELDRNEAAADGDDVPFTDPSEPASASPPPGAQPPM